MNPPFKDLTGLKFNHLFVLSFSHVARRHRYWFCRCDCGVERSFRGDGLKNGRIKTCGCSQKAKSEETRRKISENRKGKSPKTRPPEFGQKMSLVRTGMKFSDDHRKHLSEMRTGKRHSVETRLFLSTLNRGKKNWNWNPNRSDGDRAKRNREYVEYNFWREDVFKRDEYTCQNCMKGGKLCAHHIESFADNIELRIDLSNGITLCKKCHVNFHHLYGYGKNTREHLNDFLGIQNLKQATGGA